MNFKFKFFLILNVFIGLTALGAEPIVLGQSAAFKGPSAALGTELWRGAQAYFSYVNDHGGVNGRKIEVVAVDDSYEGDNTLQNTINFGNNPKIFALFGYVGTPTIVRALPAIQKFNTESGLFLFSNFTGAQPQREPPHDKYVFNIRASYRLETAGLVENFYKLGYRKFGVFIQNDAYGRSGADGVARALKNKNLKILAEASYNRGALLAESMKEQVKILKDAGVEVIISIGAYAGCAAFIRDARLADFNGPIANVSFVGPIMLLRFLKEEEARLGKNFMKMLVNSQVVPPFEDRSYPLVREYEENMKKYNPKLPENLVDKDYSGIGILNFGSLEGYLNAKVFVEIAKRVPSEKFTRLEFIRALNNMKPTDFGTKVKLRFSADDNQASDEVYYTTPVDGSFREIKDWTVFK